MSPRRSKESSAGSISGPSRGLFWAMTMRLSSGRRILLLIALVLLLFPSVRFTHGQNEFDSSGTQFFGGVVLLVLLALELADRITMKRDLEIAREIQSWLMLSKAFGSIGSGEPLDGKGL
jgi:hypothetical protein